MAMTSNPTTTQSAHADFTKSTPKATVLGTYIGPKGTLVQPAYDPTGHVLNHSVAAGETAPTVKFVPYSELLRAGKVLVHLGAIRADSKGVADVWYSAVDNTTYVDTAF
jgi:hypothetical protein